MSEERYVPKEKMESHRVKITIAIIGLIGIVLAAIAPFLCCLIFDCTKDDPPVHAVLSPKENETVSDVIDVTGTLGKIPSGNHVWLATQIANFMWPKQPEIPAASRSWAAQIYEGAKPGNGNMMLVLFTVGEEGNSFIREWFRNGQKTGDFPGLKPTEIPENSILYVVKVKKE